MFKLLLALALVAIVQAGPFKKVPKVFHGGRIVGGVEAKIEDFPYQASMRINNQHGCGASILDKTTILTAAHCTDGTKVAPIALQAQGAEVTAGSVGHLSGWGVIYDGDTNTQIMLRKTDVDIISRAQCAADYYYHTITDQMLCAERKGTDTCRGDSGGPLVVGGKQVGIVSWGEGCSIPNNPGVCSKVSKLRPWIDANK